MQIDYSLNANDMADFQVYWWRKKNKLKPWMLVFILAIIMSGSQFQLLLSNPGLFLCYAGIPFVIIIAFAFWFVPVAAKIRTRVLPGFLDQRSLSIDTTHIIEKTSISETKLDWNRIQAIEEGAKCLYFFLNNQYALLIPKRAFSSHAEAQAFLDKSRRFWEAAKSGQPISPNGDGIWPPPPRIGA